MRTWHDKNIQSVIIDVTKPYKVSIPTLSTHSIQRNGEIVPCFYSNLIVSEISTSLIQTSTKLLRMFLSLRTIKKGQFDVTMNYCSFGDVQKASQIGKFWWYQSNIWPILSQEVFQLQFISILNKIIKFHHLK